MNSRSPYREQAKGRAAAAAPPVLEQLGPLIVLAQLFWLDLCVVRTAADVLGGSLSVEGGLALALAIILSVFLVRGFLRSRRRRAPRLLATTPGTPPARRPR
jgi:hypothetical protein